MQERFRRQTFEPLLGGTFRLQGAEGETLDLKLVQIRETPKPAEDFECFSLLFKGPPDRTFEQGLVFLKHETAGEFHLFLVPVDRDEQGFSYEAVFNLKTAVL